MEVRAEQTLLATLGEVERGHATTESFLPLLAIWHVKSKQITPNLWQNITTYYWLFHPHIPISIPIEISATEVIYCTYMFSDKLLLAFGITHKSINKLVRIKTNLWRVTCIVWKGDGIIGMWYFTPHEREGAHVHVFQTLMLIFFFLDQNHGTDCQDQRLRDILEKLSWN